MLRDFAPEKIILINFLLMIMWHLIILFICMNLASSFFDYRKRMYIVRKWERNGGFYINVLKIKKWKDSLPQFVSKKGFSKRSLKSFSELNKEYLERFIIETCRAEWNHFMCCMYWIISFCINSTFYAIIFSLIPVLANLPFLFIQRFNRIRLLRLISHNNSSLVVASESKSL